MRNAATIERRAGGPKTAAGKARCAQNARKHGLDRSAASDPAFAAEIEELALRLVGHARHPGWFSCARAVAAAEIDLRRAARARSDLWAAAWRPPPPATADLISAAARLASGCDHEKARRTASRLQPLDPISDPATAARLIAAVFAIDRYEQRAFSRRRRALRALDAACCGDLAQSPDQIDSVFDPGDEAHAGSLDPAGDFLAERTSAFGIAADCISETPIQLTSGEVEEGDEESDWTLHELVTSMVVAGVPPERIARRLGLTLEALEERYADALELGPDIMAAEVNRALFDRAVGGNVGACIYILKKHAGWRSRPVRGPPSPTPEERAKKQALLAEVNAILNRRPSTP